MSATRRLERMVMAYRVAVRLSRLRKLLLRLRRAKGSASEVA